MGEKYKIFSFFSGAGFLDLGFEAAGFEIVFANEISPEFAYANQYARTRMSHKMPRYGLNVADVNLYADNETRSGELGEMFAFEKKWCSPKPVQNNRRIWICGI